MLHNTGHYYVKQYIQNGHLYVLDIIMLNNTYRTDYYLLLLRISQIPKRIIMLTPNFTDYYLKNSICRT